MLPTIFLKFFDLANINEEVFACLQAQHNLSKQELILHSQSTGRPLMHETLKAPRLLTNRQFQWTGNGHSQLPLAELGKPSPNIDLLRTTGSNGRA